jgi:hypothetical protein
MESFSRGRPSASMVVALVALFAALAGAAVAATVITGKQVKDSSLTGRDVKNSSLTGSDIKDKSLAAKDFNGSVRGPVGGTGPTGATGAAGATGQTGPAGPISLQYVIGNPVTLPAGGNVTNTVACPSGKSVTGGGATILTIGPDVIMDSSYPSDDASDADSIRDNAWSVAYNNPTISASSFLVYAICTTPSSTS